MTKKKDPSDITETPQPVTAKPNVYQDVPPIQRTSSKTSQVVDNSPIQQDIINFIDNPENINKAVEGSMAKRNEVLNRKDPSEQPRHNLSNKNFIENIAVCSVCGPTKIRRGRYCINAYYASKVKYGSSREKEIAQNYFNFKDMNIIKPDACPICGSAGVKLVRDHDHATKQPRGYICSACNFGLGYFNDNVQALQRAIEYLEKDRPLTNNEGSGPAHMSSNSYGSSVPQAPPIQIGEADTGVSDLLTEDSKPSTGTANAPTAPGVREELE